MINLKIFHIFQYFSVSGIRNFSNSNLRLFAEQVYYSSLVSGTESIGAANGYYNLGNVWSREPANQQQALSLYIKAVECWLKIIQEKDLTLSEAEIGETMNMLTTVAEVKK